MATEVGRQATVAALSSSPPALQQLSEVLGLRAKVLTAAAGADTEANELVGCCLPQMHRHCKICL